MVPKKDDNSRDVMKVTPSRMEGKLSKRSLLEAKQLISEKDANQMSKCEVKMPTQGKRSCQRWHRHTEKNVSCASEMVLNVESNCMRGFRQRSTLTVALLSIVVLNKDGHIETLRKNYRGL